MFVLVLPLQAWQTNANQDLFILNSIFRCSFIVCIISGTYEIRTQRELGLFESDEKIPQFYSFKSTCVYSCIQFTVAYNIPLQMVNVSNQ